MIHIAAVFYGITYFATLAYKLISYPTPFFDWDESIYMQAGKEMLQNLSFIPTWSGHVWLEKPPLAPLLFGFIHKFIPVMPEISVRLFVLLISILVLLLVYVWVLKLTKKPIIALFTIVLTSLNPVFLQRAQVVNIDSVMLIGWLGYTLTYTNFWSGLFFLALGVYSKSLLGFYPLFAVAGYQTLLYLTKQTSIKLLFLFIRNSLIQFLILSTWYLVMFFKYGNQFISIHFTDHLVRRVTSSIEFHFGKRTFYLDLLLEQFGWWSLLIIITVIILIVANRKNFKTLTSIVPHVLFIPWFIFLNLTKTKIMWYSYPIIHQMAYLAVYPLMYIKNRYVQLAVGLLFLAITAQSVINSIRPFTSYYSQYDGYYYAAREANERCNSLYVLVDKEYRKNRLVLQSLNLLITTTNWYSNHPALVYYFEKPLTFEYSKNVFLSKIKDQCLLIHNSDEDIVKSTKFTLKMPFSPLWLLRK